MQKAGEAVEDAADRVKKDAGDAAEKVKDATSEAPAEPSSNAE